MRHYGRGHMPIAADIAATEDAKGDTYVLEKDETGTGYRNIQRSGEIDNFCKKRQESASTAAKDGRESPRIALLKPNEDAWHSEAEARELMS